MMVALYNEFGCIPSSAIFENGLSQIGVSSSLNFWWNSAVRPSGPGLLFVERFLIRVSTSVFVIGLFISSVSSWFSFWKAYVFLTICPFLPSCPFYWHVVAHMILCISALLVVTSFSFLILLI